jgi:hypothetical protein
MTKLDDLHGQDSYDDENDYRFKHLPALLIEIVRQLVSPKVRRPNPWVRSPASFF